MVYRYGPWMRASPLKRSKNPGVGNEKEKRLLDKLKNTKEELSSTYNDLGVIKLGPPSMARKSLFQGYSEQGSDSSKGSESLSPNTEQASSSTIVNTKASDPLLLGSDHTSTVGVVNEEGVTHATDYEGQHKTCADTERKSKWRRIPRVNADGDKQNTHVDTPHISDSRKRDLMEAMNSPMEVDDAENVKK